jgi:hypothetical protein
MKLSQNDILKIRGALIAARIAGINSVVFANGHVSGVHEKLSSVMFSSCALELDSGISIGLGRLLELEKRMALFSDIEIQYELSAQNKMSKLLIRGKGGKIDYRCTDERLIQYPKSVNDEVDVVCSINKPEISLLSKGAKTMGSENLTLQIQRTGIIHFECHDVNNDQFKIDLESPALFVESEHSYVNDFAAGSNGVFLSMLENIARDEDVVTFSIMKTGYVMFNLHGHDIYVSPLAQIGE